MEYKELLQNARGKMGAVCRACDVCDGRACAGRIPGPGDKGTGGVAAANARAWQAIGLRMDTLHEGYQPNTGCTLFGKTFALPVFAGPVGAVNSHYGPSYDDAGYNEVMVSACAAAGVAAFTGDGVNPAVMQAATASIRRAGGVGVPTIKPWSADVIAEKLALVQDSGAFAVAMDVDAAGLPFLKNSALPAGCKTKEELAAIVQAAGMPFIVKGVMTGRGAVKAMEAGAAAVVVSNHGGRVLDGCCPTAEALPEVVAAVDGKIPVLVDGGIRSGVDVFRALALGAAGVVICRPFVVAAYGGGAAGVRCYLDKLAGELSDAMLLCGARTLADIAPDMVRRPR